MYLKNVIVNGFKSFADETQVTLDRGVTAIVGPNGCGKSNIADAIRWVLGEQSAKAMRGNKMHDVIFGGADRRKALSMCEVSLIFTECEEQLGTAYNEVEIKRRVSRDGQGDYFLNGKACRLKDITRLFMDTGIGRESYSFMAQGQISQIIDSNPAGRRALFEEAAGITRYKAQRKEALNKLARVDQNLERVSDVIEEVGKRIGSLKRQASKTLRYKRLKHRMTHLDLACNSHQYHELSFKLKDIGARSAELKKSVGSSRDELESSEVELEKDKLARGELYQKLKETQEQVFDLRSEKEQAEGKTQFAVTRHEELEVRISEIRSDVEELDGKIKDLAGKAKDSSTQQQSFKDIMDSSDAVFKEKAADLDKVTGELAELELELGKNKQALLIAEGSIVRLRSNCTSFEVELKTSETKHATLKDSLHEFNKQRDDTAIVIEELVNKEKESNSERENSESEVNKAVEKSTGLRDKYRAKQVEIQESDRTLAKLTAQLGLLEDLQSKFEGFSDGAKAILQGKLSDVISKKSYRPLTKYLDVDEEYTQAIEILLGSATDAITLDDRSQVVAVSSELQEKALGRAALHINAKTGSSKKAVKLPSWLKKATSVVRAKNDEMQPYVESLLEKCYFCEDLKQFLDYWEQNEEFDFFLVVTDKNELIDSRGLVFGGYSKKPDRESSLIQREVEIKRLKKASEKENDKLTDLNEEALKIQDELDKSDVVVQEKRDRLVEIGKEISSLQAEERSARESLRKSNDSIKNVERDIASLEEQRKRAEERLNRASEELKKAENGIEENRDKIRKCEADIGKSRIERESSNEKLTAVRVDFADKKKNLELIEQGLDDIEFQRKDASQRLMRRNQEIDTMTAQMADLKKEQETEKNKAEEIGKTLTVAIESQSKHGESLNALEKKVEEVEGKLSAARTSLGDREGQLHKLEVLLTRERSQISFLEEKVQSDYELDLEGLDWKEYLWNADKKFVVKVKMEDLEDDSALDVPQEKQSRGDPTEEDLLAMDDTDWDAVEEEVKVLKTRINAMGEINLVAIEEYAELKERHDFLKSQSEDLWNSKEELLKAIDEINVTSQKMFEETFEQIRKNFKFCFGKLNGGTADLELIEAEDILESGIEIKARPVGTKLQVLSLLSGGQKTMTAVSLLFAIYMVKPSPFCVLDELDAPLDDANIRRFTEMLSTFLEYSQFLIITHNKQTLSVATTLYGVTMQEPGVTKLISLRFNKDGKPDVDPEFVK